MEEHEHPSPRRSRIVMSTDEATSEHLESEPTAVIRLSLDQAEQLRAIEERAEVDAARAVARSGAKD